MFYRLAIALVFCFVAVNSQAQSLQRCTGPASDSQEDFELKYNAAPIVAFGKVTEVKGNKATFTVSCTLKGDLSVSLITFEQFQDVMNLTECHYLTADKEYIVFLDSMKADQTTIYRLANWEEIEVTKDTVNAFLDEECSDEDDFNIEMTMWAYDNKLKCTEFTAPCKQATQTSIRALSYPPLTKTSKFLGGFKKTLPVPSMSDDGISGKSSGNDDSDYRNAAVSLSFFTPIIAILAGLVMKFNF